MWSKHNSILETLSSFVKNVKKLDKEMQIRFIPLYCQSIFFPHSWKFLFVSRSSRPKSALLCEKGGKVNSEIILSQRNVKSCRQSCLTFADFVSLSLAKVETLHADKESSSFNDDKSCIFVLNFVYHKNVNKICMQELQKYDCLTRKVFFEFLTL